MNNEAFQPTQARKRLSLFVILHAALVSITKYLKGATA